MSSGEGCVKGPALAALKVQFQQILSATEKEVRPSIPKKELLRPFSEKEIRQMIRAMEPVRLKNGDGWAIRGALEGSELSLERMGVVLSDVITLLADLKSHETLGRLKKAGTNKEDLAWIKKAFKAVHFCAEARFGDLAYKESIEIVEKYSSELESMILKGLAFEKETLLQPGSGR
jgi:hypothetical protein